MKRRNILQLISISATLTGGGWVSQKIFKSGKTYLTNNEVDMLQKLNLNQLIDSDFFGHHVRHEVANDFMQHFSSRQLVKIDGFLIPSNE